MSNKSISEENDSELSWEEAVSRYLEENPDYFQRHADVLGRLELRHQAGGGSISLIERQVQLLRGQKQTAENQLQELIAIARENDAIANRLHRYALAMIDSVSLDDVFDATYEILQRDFKLDAVAVMLRAPTAVTARRAEFIDPNDKRFGELLAEFTSGKPRCGRLDDTLVGYVFGDRAAQAASCALVPLGSTRPQGLLGLGSSDPRRFAVNMGSVHLVRLGEILLHGLTRHLRDSVI